MALLSACAPAGSEPACFALVPYSPAMQAQAAEDLAALPAGAMLARMIDDYGDLRARIRGACAR